MVENQGRKSVQFASGAFQIVIDNIPSAPQGKVVVRVAYSTVNPYDLFVVNHFPKQEGTIPGSDGCGTIIEAGEGVNPSFVGRKVTFLGSSWTTHTIADPNMLIFLDDSVDLKTAANAMVNPLTAIGLIETLRKHESKVAIQMAASSQLGKQFIRLCKKEGIELINIVRKDEQIANLKEEVGAQHVLNQLSPNFFDELKKLVSELKPNVILEYVGGDLPGKILQLMPNNSSMIAIGNLTHTNLSIDSGDIFFNEKSVSGFILFSWLLKLTPDQRAHAFNVVADDLKNGGKIFGSEVALILPQSDWQTAVNESENMATKGKILLSME